MDARALMFSRSELGLPSAFEVPYYRMEGRWLTYVDDLSYLLASAA